MVLKLYYPVNPYYPFQGFGESSACINPTTKKVTSKVNGVCPIGSISLYESLGMKGHTGIDLLGPDNHPCYYGGPDGFVEEINTEIERGLGVGVITNERFVFAGGEYHAKTRYWHFKGINVVKGQAVKTGDLLGWCDSTGYSSGSHLHFELKPVAINSNDVWHNVLQSNGYFGGIDPMPYFTGEYAHIADESITKNLQLNMRDPQVKILQDKLRKLGYSSYFSLPVSTDFYGPETRKASFAFQKDHVMLTWTERYIDQGRYFGPKSRNAINNINLP